MMCANGALLLALCLLLAAPAAAQPKPSGQQLDKADKDRQKESKVSEDRTTNLRIEVTGGEKAQAVDQASIYVKYMEERMLRRDKKVELNLKTNRDGVARLPDAPRGKVLIQVIAPGWKTFGKWFELDQDEQTVKIQLQKPPRWY